MGIQTRQVEYRDGDTVLEAHVAWDDAVSGPRPGVLVSHAWAGRSDFEDRKAERLAELGYAGFALDLYGKGVLGKNNDENAKLMKPFIDDRRILQRRMKLALEQIRGQKEVDSNRVAAIGFCFGGLCVLDLARTGADVRGVVSFHGLLGAPGNTEGKHMKARALVLHGWNDPMAPPEQVLEFAKEMAALRADWQLHAYGNAMHAFTNPQANAPDHGLLYDATADRRSWDSMWLFLNEAFA
ncbi:MAG: dienelactone hydrolase family protein [Gammaproteobacteria bacterium]|nr:dienelactone hydrolase family protein [Gammaproteobacteria bacterium]MDH4254027.1 dienelactone hydrolase family protein [Gammaproteobacteria bacterium]MDH5310326.1 dienelactone hydrolase family protein [Gammaproteobacteria bacterium]